MALMKSTSRSIPEDGIVMTEMEATTYVWDLVSNWESTSETWALRYGPAILGSINAVSGVLINQHFRRKLKLGNYGYFSSVIPNSIMPGMLTALFHRHLISTGMLLMKDEACPICYEVKSAVVQLGFGIAYPMLLAPTSSLMFASRYCTFRVPGLAEGPKVIFNFVRKLTRPLTPTLTALAALQFIASSVITYFEMKNNFTMRKKMTETENKMLNDE